MVKTVILPIVAFLALLVQLIFNVEIPKETVDALAYGLGNAIFAGVTVYGIITNRKEKHKK